MPPSDHSEQQWNGRAQLGFAIGRRAEEVYQRTIALLYRKGQAGAVSDAYLDYRWGRSVIGTLLIARWLVSGIAADKGEVEWISKSGGAAAREGVPLVETTRGHLHWRDILIQVVQEEAARLGTPPDVSEGVINTIQANADASLVRIANAYDTQLRETNAELSRASQFKSEFLAKMSHQLRTPLTAIIGFCEVLSQGMTASSVTIKLKTSARSSKADLSSSSSSTKYLIYPRLRPARSKSSSRKSTCPQLLTR